MSDDDVQNSDSTLQELEALRRKNEALEAAVAEGKQREEELARTRSVLLAAIERSPAGIVISEAPSGKILAANRAALDDLHVA